MRRTIVAPGFRRGFDHGGSDHRAIGPRAFHLGHFAQVHFERAIGNQLDIIDAKHFLPAVMPGAIAIGDVQDRSANGFPHRSAPAGFEGAMNLGARIRGRRRSQPEGIGRPDACEIDAQDQPLAAPWFIKRSWIACAASLPS